MARATPTLLLSSLALALAAGPAQALEAGDWLLRGGVHYVSPKSDNGSLADGALDADVGGNARPSATLTYMATANLGIELLAAVPFEHDIKLNGAKAGSTRHLPPTLSLQYHFEPMGVWRPYVGAGLNYTAFFSEKSTGALEGASLKLDDSWGLAAQIGLDVDVDPDWFVNAEIRYLDIDTDVSVDGVDVGTVNIDPWAFGLSVGMRF